ncbi:MAG TPA: hypothetical protein VF209_00995 [Patescibacteria group bacterium]
MPSFPNFPLDIYSAKTFPFLIDTSGWYLVRITAQVKGETQRTGQQTDDEDLVFKIDDTSFPKSGTTNNVINSPAAFNGGTQHDQKKTVYVLLQLIAGSHTLTLIPDHHAHVNRVEYRSVEIKENTISLKLNEYSEERNRQPWITLVTVGGKFTRVTLTVDIRWHWRDGDDIQVRIDGQIVPNRQSLKHKEWIFTSNITSLFQPIQTKSFKLPESSNKTQINYVELWADRMPALKEIVLKLTKSSSTVLAKYSLGPNDQDYNRYDEHIIFMVNEWNKKFLSQPFPPSDPLDPNLVKAMMFVESKMGFYEPPPNHYPASPDVMQIGDPRNPAIHTLKNDGWVSPETGKVAREYMWTSKGPEIMDYGDEVEINTVKNSIYWSVRWLFHLAEIIHENGSRSWEKWQETVKRYNGEGDLQYVDKVFKIYKKGDWK